MILDSFLDMNKFIPNKQFWHLFRAIEKHGGVLRFVGGAVRDALAGIEGSDIDLATDMSPEELMEACAEEGFKTVPIGIKFGTLGVLVDGKVLEITSLRKDVKTDGRHAEVEFTDDWIADASRRDLTINAVYADEKGNVFDYFNGIEDLKNGVVRFIGNPAQRVSEDYLRILRFFRFYSMFGKTPIDAKALKACVENKDNLKTLSIERIRDELIKLAMTENFVPTLKIMFENNILDYILPASDRIDKLEHLIKTVSALKLEKSALRRLFVLYCPNEELALNLAERMHLSRKQKDIMQKWARVSVSIKDFSDEKIVKRYVYMYGKEFCRDRLIIEYAIEKADYTDLPAQLDLIERIKIKKFPLNGRNIMQMAPVPEKNIGLILKKLEQKWVESDFSRSADELKKDAAEMIKTLADNRCLL